MGLLSECLRRKESSTLVPVVLTATTQRKTSVTNLNNPKNVFRQLAVKWLKRPESFKQLSEAADQMLLEGTDLKI